MDRQQLYSQGYTDQQLSDAQGVSVTAICLWRKRLNLLPNQPDRVDVSKMPMKEGEIARQFLGDLIRISDMAGRALSEQDIGRVMMQYNRTGGIAL